MSNDLLELALDALKEYVACHEAHNATLCRPLRDASDDRLDHGRAAIAALEAAQVVPAKPAPVQIVQTFKDLKALEADQSKPVYELAKELAAMGEKALAAQPVGVPAGMKEAVDRFLGWKLPQDFYPDCFVTFDRDKATNNNLWPSGTNLLTAKQAKAMFEYAFSAVPSLPVPAAVEKVRGSASTGWISEFEGQMRLRWLKSLVETQQDNNRSNNGSVEPDTGAWVGPEWVDTVHEALDDLVAAAEASKGFRFSWTRCSSCGQEFGPGDCGYSHCSDHAALAVEEKVQWDMPDAKDVFAYINKTPVVQSLLYDLNLLPEQIDNPIHWDYMLSVCEHFLGLAKEPSPAVELQVVAINEALEWAAQLAVFNDPRTGDWMYDDRDDLAAAIREGKVSDAQAAIAAQGKP